MPKPPMALPMTRSLNLCAPHCKADPTQKTANRIFDRDEPSMSASMFRRFIVGVCLPQAVTNVVRLEYLSASTP